MKTTTIDRDGAGPAAAARPRTKPAEVRREELMNAAERLFLEQGIAATSVDEIVSAADVAKGTFYIHFESKEHLLLALRERFIVHFCNDVGNAMERRRAGDWTGRLKGWVEAGINGYLDRVALHDVVFHEFRPDDRRLKHENPVADQLADLLERGTKEGAWSVDSPRETAVMLFFAMHGAVDDAIASAERPDRRRLIRLLNAFFLRAVGASASSPLRHQARSRTSSK
jgi:AcrR family transcriptional regulator